MTMKHDEKSKRILEYFIGLLNKLPTWQIFIVCFLTIAVIIACTFDPDFARFYLISYIATVLFITLHYYVSGRYLE